MKRILTFFIAAAMCFALAACRNQVATESGIKRYEEAPSEPQVSDNMSANEAPDTEVQTIDLVGPWHLDQEKTDISIIESAWDTFPGYGEWGASMEIRSDGFMSWYIGAVGGSGTYSIDGNVLHTALFTEENGEKAEMPLDFLIVGNGELKMAYGNMEITWAYGDQEDVPANDD